MTRRRSEHLALSLFPFLSVLACVIGVLSVLLAGLAVGEMSGRAGAEIEDAAKLRAALALLGEGREELEGLEAKIESTGRLQRRLEDARDALADFGIAPGTGPEERREIIALRAALAELDARRDLAKERRIAVEAERASIEAKLAAAEGDRVAPPILLDPRGIGRDRPAYFVECRREGLQVRSTSDATSYWVPAHEIDGGSAHYAVFLRRVRAVPRGLVVFLIRPDGVATYRRADEIARRIGTPSSALPLPGDGDLDFRLVTDPNGPPTESAEG